MNFVKFLRTPFSQNTSGRLHLYEESAWRSKLPMMNIVNMTLKNKIATLNNFMEMRHMTLNDPKLDIKRSLDTLVYH